MAAQFDPTQRPLSSIPRLAAYVSQRASGRRFDRPEQAGTPSHEAWRRWGFVRRRADGGHRRLTVEWHELERAPCWLPLTDRQSQGNAFAQSPERSGTDS
eukprot:scaffold45469_cov70-Phaeocystis_antarctica.AAC.2